MKGDEGMQFAGRADKKRNTHQIISGLIIMVGIWYWGMIFSSCDKGFSSATITAEEFRFTPHLVKLPAHQVVRLIVRNQGREGHVFQSRALGNQSIRWLENSLTNQWQVGKGILLKPGQHVEFSIELAPGMYPFRCGIRGHRGMEGTLMVVK